MEGGVPAVVAMQYQVTDEAALAFCRVFYSTIVSGHPIDASMAEARKALQLGNSFEWVTPILFMRAPNGVLFDMSAMRNPPSVRPLLATGQHTAIVLPDADVAAPAPAAPPRSVPPPNSSKRRKGALVLMGGGVKGLALAGAIRELERYYDFDCFVGTSAGAIAAVLLASGYSGSDLERELREKDFSELLDGSIFTSPFRLLFRGGLHNGSKIQEWIEMLLEEKIKRAGYISLDAMPSRAIVFASTSPRGLITFDSNGTERSVPAAFAVRCSMSIPFFFVPQAHAGSRLLDGGLLSNFPVEEYLKLRPGTDFVALFLGRDGPPRKPRSQLGEMLAIWLGRNERMVVDEHRDSTVVIDADPVGTVDFNLTAEEKNHLVLQGRAAALAHLASSELTSREIVNESRAATKAAEAIKLRVLASRLTRRRSRRVIGLAFAGLFAVALYPPSRSAAKNYVASLLRRIWPPETVHPDLGPASTQPSSSGPSQAYESGRTTEHDSGVPTATSSLTHQKPPPDASTTPPPNCGQVYAASAAACREKHPYLTDAAAFDQCIAQADEQQEKCEHSK